MRHAKIRLEILREFETQYDFAEAWGTSESKVSKVLRGRRKLSMQEAKEWRRLLKCDADLLEPVVAKS